MISPAQRELSSQELNCYLTERITSKFGSVLKKQRELKLFYLVESLKLSPKLVHKNKLTKLKFSNAGRGRSRYQHETSYQDHRPHQQLCLIFRGYGASIPPWQLACP